MANSNNSIVPHILVPSPDTPYYLWQLEVQRYYFATKGWDATWIVYTTQDRDNKPSSQLQDFCTRADVIVVPDTREPEQMNYHPAMKPWLISKYMATTTRSDATSYVICDPDALPTGATTLPIPSEGQWWGTCTDSYTGGDYLRSKGAFAYLVELMGTGHAFPQDARMIGAGAQYIIEGGYAEYWDEVARKSLSVYKWAESPFVKGLVPPTTYPLQSWCSEMYVTQMLAPKYGLSINASEEMNMTWANGHSNDWNTHGFFHDAGIVREMPGEFCKLPYQQAPWFASIPQVDETKSAYRYVQLIQETAKTLGYEVTIDG